jgi:hypothetical protein
LVDCIVGENAIDIVRVFLQGDMRWYFDERGLIRARTRHNWIIPLGNKPRSFSVGKAIVSKLLSMVVIPMIFPDVVE